MNLFGDPIETSSAVAPAVSVGSHIPSVSTYTYIESAYICISTRYLQSACFFRKFSFLLLFFFFWHSVTLSRSCNPKRVNLVKQKAQETVLTRFQIVFYLNMYLCKQTKGKKKKVIFCSLLSFGLLSSIIRSDACSERWTPSPGGRAKPLPLCVLKPHVLTVHGAATCGPVPWADPLTKPVQVPAKGREAERNASTPLPSIQSNCSKLLLSYFLQVLI